MFSISTTPLDAAELRARMGAPEDGALVTFEGWVRNHHGGKPVTSLTYEAYAALAEREGARIVAEAKAKFAVSNVLCEHRTGALEIGDIAVWVGVTAHHRGAAFEACRYVIDEIKSRVPIWKHERYADGTEAWVNCSHDHAPEGA